MASCDDINEDERFIAMEEVEPQRAVLLEEFTGQYCRNCPKAHEIINQLKEQYGDKFISVSIHAGPAVNAIPESESNEYYQGLKTDDGDYYASMWGINTYPPGVFDRTSGVLDRDKWAATIIDELTKPSDVEIELQAVYNAETNSVEIATELKPVANISGYLQLWITESDIHTLQLNGDNYEMDYQHDHVYRAAVNTTSGEAVELTSNVFKDYTHSIAVKSHWVPANLSVVAFVYNNSGVLQAAETNVVVAQ
jgi:hypothetical protein